MNRYIVKQTLGKRFLAAFLDIIFIFVLSVFLYTPASALSTYVGWGEVAYRLYYHGIMSGLYDANELEGLNLIEDSARQPEALYKFYVDTIYLDGVLQQGYAPIFRSGNEHNTAEDYYVNVLGKGSDDTLFDFDAARENDYEIPAKAGKNEEVVDFYKQAIIEADILFKKHPTIEPLLIKHYQFLFLTIYFTYITAAFLLIVLLPLLLKDKVSLGKLITGTVVANKLGFKVKTSQAFIRNLAMFIFSYGFFFAPLHAISFGLALTSKDNASLYDRLAVTMVADKKSSLVFKNGDEEAAYRKKLAQQLLEIERRKEAGRQEKRSNIEVINPLD